MHDEHGRTSDTLATRAAEALARERAARKARKPHDAPHDAPQGEHLVRDVPVRVFHWALVASVAVALLTGFFGEENLLDIHVLAGQAVVVLVLFRIAWWFVGGRYSRLSAYPLSPRKALEHLGSIIRGRSPLTAGHNPLGAFMIITLVGLLFLITASGIITLGGEENQGPLKAFVPYRLGDAAGEVHEVLAIILLFAIAGHLGGVFLETVIFRHPLLRAMTRGMMPVPEEQAEHGRLILRGLFVLGVVLVFFLGIWNVLEATPDTRWRAISYARAYADNCADCHHAHHPSLRTADMWERIINGLDDHFGEDASIDEKTAAEILAFLKANDATHFDTEAAVRLGRAKTPDMRISSAAWWKKRHAGLAEAVFRAPAVGSKANCNACHKDAQTGRFDDVNIHVPPAALRQADSNNSPGKQQDGG